MSETLYIFHDKTGTCFDDFAKIDDYSHHVAHIYFKGQEPLTVGDMLVFRDDLNAAGFHWGTDFFVTKTKKP